MSSSTPHFFEQKSDFQAMIDFLFVCSNQLVLVDQHGMEGGVTVEGHFGSPLKSSETSCSLHLLSLSLFMHKTNDRSCDHETTLELSKFYNCGYLPLILCSDLSFRSDSGSMSDLPQHVQSTQNT